MRQPPLTLILSGLLALATLSAAHTSPAQDSSKRPAPAPVMGKATEDDKALADFYLDAMKSQEQDRTQEIFALFTDPSPEARAWVGAPDALAGDNKMIRALAGEIPATEKDLQQTRLVLTRMKGYIENSRTVPKSQTYSIPHIPASTTLADLASPDAKLPRFARVQMNIAFPKLTPVTTSPGSCEIAWSDDALFLKYRVSDASPISKFTERDSAIFDDDCVEIFLVSKASPAEYWELNIGRNSCIRDVFVKKTPGKWFGQLSNEATLKGLEFKITEITRDDKPSGYTVLAKIPWTDLLGPDVKPKIGDKFPFTVGFSDSFKKHDNSQGQTYFSNIYTFVGYHDVARYDTLLLK